MDEQNQNLKLLQDDNHAKDLAISNVREELVAVETDKSELLQDLNEKFSSLNVAYSKLVGQKNELQDLTSSQTLEIENLKNQTSNLNVQICANRRVPLLN